VRWDTLPKRDTYTITSKPKLSSVLPYPTQSSPTKRGGAGIRGRTRNPHSAQHGASRELAQ